MVNVTLLLGVVEVSFSFQVTSVPAALAVPLMLADPSVTLAFGSPKVQVGMTFQSSSKGWGSRGVSFASVGIRSFSR